MSIKKIVSFALMSGVLVFASNAPMASAAVNYNNLIDDHIFDKDSSMTADQINAFLNGFPNSCISPNSGFSAKKPTGYSPSTGFVYSSGYYTAGSVIYAAAQAYDINPQVLLATLQKEQSLVAGGAGYCNDGDDHKYAAAAGYGCPDGGAKYSYSGISLYKRGSTVHSSVNPTCVNKREKAGFAQQVIRAAWLLKFSKERSLGHVNWAVIKPGWDNSDDLETCYSGFMTQGYRARCPSGSTTYFSGYATIDGTSVHMDTGATASLYVYTPHKHGNSNFVTIFSTWFGSTHATYTPLETPRWMETTANTYKKNPFTGENQDDVIPQGTQIKFVDKIYVNGEWYLRTASDSQNVRNKGVPNSHLTDISYDSFATPRYMELTVDAYKVDPRNGKADKDHFFKEGADIHFDEKIYVNGKWYYRSSHDTELGNDRAIPASKVTELAYVPFDIPRYMVIKEDTNKLDPVTKTEDPTTINKDTQIQFASKLRINDDWYYRTNNDTTNNNALAIPASDIQDIPYQAISPSAKWLQLNADATKIFPRTGVVTSHTVTENTQLQIAQQITVNGTTYYRTAYDASHGIDQALTASSFADIPYTALATPKWLRLKADTYKINPIYGTRVDQPVSKNTPVEIAQQITINGVLYYRTVYDASNNLGKAIPASSLGAIPYVSLNTPREMTLNKDAGKYVPNTGQAVGDTIANGTEMFFATKIYIDGEWYLRTSYDTNHKLDKGILLSDLTM